MRILYFSFLLAAISTRAQDYQITWSDIQEGPGKGNVSEILSTTDRIYVVVDEGISGEETMEQNHLYSFDHQLKTLCTADLKYPVSEIKAIPDAFFTSEDKLFTSVEVRDKTTKKNTFNICSYAGCNLTTPKSIASLSIEGWLNFGSQELWDTKQPNRFVVLSEEPWNRAELIKMKLNKMAGNKTLILVDENFKELKREKLGPEVEVLDIFVDTSDNIILLGDVTNNREEKKATGEKSFIRMYSYSASGTTFHDIRMEDGYEDYDSNFEVLDDGHLVWTGFYTQGNGNGAMGLFYIKLNPADGKTVINSFIPFDPDYVQSQNKHLVIGQKGLGELYLKSLEIQPNGTVFLFGEVAFSPPSHAMSTGTVPQVYIYGDITVFKLNEAGKPEWKTIIPKKQIEKGINFLTDYYSFGMEMSDEQLYLLYNGIPGTENEDDEKAMRRPGNSSAVFVTVDRQTGAFTKDVLFENASGSVCLPWTLYKIPASGKLFIARGERYDTNTGLKLKMNFSVGLLTVK